MNIRQGLESSVIGVGDNYIVLENCVGSVDVNFTVRGGETNIYSFRYSPNDGVLDVNLREITRLVYDNLEFYQDPFTYDGDVLYTETDNYHFLKIDFEAQDSSDTVSINDISVVNAALDVGECLILTSLTDKILDQEAAVEPTSFIALNYDLNFALH